MLSVDAKPIPNCLRKYRKARGLKQKEVAKILGYKSSSRISHWENGDCLPSTMSLFRLAALYRTVADSLFSDLLQQIKADIAETEKREPHKSEISDNIA